MEKKELYCFTTQMEKEDYKKFLYFITFKKSKKTLAALCLLSIGSSAFLAVFLQFRSIAEIAGSLIFMFFISLSFLLLKIEGQAKALFRPNTNFQKEQTITLYEDYITATNRSSDGNTASEYNKLSKLYDLPGYLLIYFNEELASLIRKQDLSPEYQEIIPKFLEDKLGVRYIKH